MPNLRVLRESVLSRSSCGHKPAVEEANILPAEVLFEFSPRRSVSIAWLGISPISAGNLL